MNRYFNGGSQGVQYFDPVTNEWTSVADQGPRPVSYDHGVAYDARSGRIYMGSGDSSQARGLYIYDLATETWTKPSSTGDVPGSFRTNDASVAFDEANQVLTVLHYENRLVYVYDPVMDHWDSMRIPAEIPAGLSFNSFYDPQLNAYFVHRARDSDTGGEMWAYRLR